uniref:Uncharacterized protein n=1 Tax=Arundo donax TaxID=35708 RepID=A0A0A9FAN3_ARUDO
MPLNSCITFSTSSSTRFSIPTCRLFTAIPLLNALNLQSLLLIVLRTNDRATKNNGEIHVSYFSVESSIIFYGKQITKSSSQNTKKVIHQGLSIHKVSTSLNQAFLRAEINYLIHIYKQLDIK